MLFSFILQYCFEGQVLRAAEACRSVILVALSALYFSIHRQQMLDNQLLQVERDSIQNDLGRLIVPSSCRRHTVSCAAFNAAARHRTGT